jgi:uncharacterized membrane protein YgdD (TMEM256/DUF423 family)
MPDVRSPWIAVGALNAVIAIAAGAFGAHGLRDRLDVRALEIFEIGARYHMYHALALVLVGVIATRGAQTAGRLFQAGIVLFSGSLYAIALTGIERIGAITPIGGLAFLVGWLWLTWTTWRR